MSRQPTWSMELIQLGIDKYYKENGHYPTAPDFDACEYLPSARQVQRRFGGMEALRTSLRLKEVNYSKGALRKAIYADFAERSLAAEDILEKELISHLGEPYVHTQKRYYRLMRNRWDFFVYHSDGYFGIDIFSTARQVNIMKNIQHKLIKYANVPTTVPIFFIVDAPHLSQSDVEKAIAGSSGLKSRPNISVQLLSTFLESTLPQFHPLDLPKGIKLVLSEI